MILRPTISTLFPYTTLFRSLKKNKIQVVLAQFGPVAHRIVKICQYLKIPLISHFHGYDASVESVIKSCNNYRSEEHTSELQSQSNLVCRLLLEKKKNKNNI